jgi:hypothetical protein
MTRIDSDLTDRVKIHGFEAGADNATVNIQPAEIHRIVDKMKNLIPTDWLVGRTWDGTVAEFAHILKNGELPSRFKFFSLKIPDQKLFLQFLGTAVSMGIVTGSTLTYWASATLGKEYLSTFGWFMVPVGAATLFLINKIDRKKAAQQEMLVNAIKQDAVRATEIIEHQQRVAKIFMNLLETFKKDGYRPNDTMLGLLQKVANIYARPSSDKYAQIAISKLENEENYLFKKKSDDSFTLVPFGAFQSEGQGNGYPTRDEMLIQIEQRLRDALHESFNEDED